MALEYISGKSIFHRLDPRTKMIFFIFILIILLAVEDTIIVALILLSIFGLYKLAGIPMKKLTEIIKPILPAFILFILLNYFVSPPREAKIYFYLVPGMAPVTLETTLIGITSALRFILFICITRFITLVTPIADILVAISKMGAPPEFAVALGIAFSSVPVLVNQFQTVIEAQKSRGAKIEQKNPIKKFFALIPVIVPSIFLTVLRGMDISKAIESKAFTYNPAKRTYRKTISMKKIDYAFIVLVAIITIIISILRWNFNFFRYDSTLKYLIEIIKNVLKLT